MDKLKPKMRVKIWLEEDTKMVFGLGSATLLREIESSGSLSSAVKNLKMSYRTAWGRIKKVEENLGVSLVVKTSGNKGGFSLSDEGRMLLEAYEKWSADVESHALKMANDLFPWGIRR